MNNATVCFLTDLSCKISECSDIILSDGFLFQKYKKKTRA